MELQQVVGQTFEDSKWRPTLRFGEHLFINSDTNFVNEQHRGLVLFSHECKKIWLDLIADRESKFQLKRTDFLFLIAPDKQTVYRHLLPKDFNTRQSDFLLKLKCVIDVAPLLASLAKLFDVYPKTDSHWNHVGSYMATQAIQNRLCINMPCLNITWMESLRTGDLGNKVSPTEHSPKIVAKFRSLSSMIYDNLIPNNGRVRVWSKQTKMETGPLSRLVLFGDSFSYDVVLFLKEMFDIVVHVHSFAVDYNLTNFFKPDIVICEITERFLLRPPLPSDGEPLETLWDEKVKRKERLEPKLDVIVPDETLFPAAAISIIKYLKELFRSREILLSQLS